MTNTTGISMMLIVIVIALFAIQARIGAHTEATVKPMVPQKLYTYAHDQLIECRKENNGLASELVIGCECAEDVTGLRRLVKQLSVDGPLLDGTTPETWCEVFIASRGTSRYDSCVTNLSRKKP